MRISLTLAVMSFAGSAHAVGRAAPVDANDTRPSSAYRRASPDAQQWPRRLLSTHSDLAVDIGTIPPEPRFSGLPMDRSAPSRRGKGYREQWLLAIEGVTHAPVDMGVQTGLEAPFGLRVFGGVGWVPPVYMGVLTGLAASASGDARARAVFENAEYRGNTWRVQVGVRPFKALGVYLDAGYARLNLSGTLALAESGVRDLAALGGAYSADTRLDMWVVELGYQAQFAERMVVGLALGSIGTVGSQTVFARQDGLVPNAVLAEVAKSADASLESYGVVPTLTLRLGFDLL